MLESSDREKIDREETREFGVRMNYDLNDKHTYHSKMTSKRLCDMCRSAIDEGRMQLNCSILWVTMIGPYR